MRLVKFKDGTYGVRRGFFFYTYLDLKSLSDWWSIESGCFKFCKADEQAAKKGMHDYLTRVNDSGAVIY